MNQYSLSFFLIMLLTNLTCEKPNNNINNKLEMKKVGGFKCTQNLKIKKCFIRVFRTKCFSINWKSCLNNFQTKESVKKLKVKIWKRLNQYIVQKIIIQKKDTGVKTDINIFSINGIVSNKQALTIRLDTVSLNVQYISKDGRDFFTGKIGEQACKIANECTEFSGQMKQLTCGQQHFEIWSDRI
jgi:hypothetical protein